MNTHLFLLLVLEDIGLVGEDALNDELPLSTIERMSDLSSFSDGQPWSRKAGNLRKTLVLPRGNVEAFHEKSPLLT